MNEEWLTPEQVSEMTGISLDRLKNLRYKRQMFSFHKIPGTRSVRYRRQDIESILQESRVEVVA